MGMLKDSHSSYGSCTSDSESPGSLVMGFGSNIALIYFSYDKLREAKFCLNVLNLHM